MTIIRRDNVFETNSSSSHSVAIASGVPIWDTIPTDDCGYITIESQEFGWQIEKSNNPAIKAAYAFQSFLDPNKHELIKNIIKEVTGCNIVTFYDPPTKYSESQGYIDHQSTSTLNEALNKFITEDRGNEVDFLRNFIFNTNSILALGSDNYIMPLNHRDPLNQSYSHSISFTGELYGEKVEFKDYAKLIQWEEGTEFEWKRCNPIGQTIDYLLDDVRNNKYKPYSGTIFDYSGKYIENRGEKIDMVWEFYGVKMPIKKISNHTKTSFKYASGDKFSIYEREYFYSSKKKDIYTNIGFLVLEIKPI